MKRIFKILALLTLTLTFLSGCTSMGNEWNKATYGNPLEYSSAQEWMARGYIRADYVNNRATQWRVNGLENRVYTDRKIALNSMLMTYGHYYTGFFQPCYEAAVNQQPCGVGGY